MALTKVSGGILQDNLNIVGVITASAFVGDVNAGVVTATGGIQAIGIYSGGIAIHSGVITALNFVGTGNTIIVHNNTVDISISGGGGGSIGIQSAGVLVGTGVTILNFVGVGNTFAVVGDRVDISIQGGGAGGGSIGIQSAGVRVSTGITDLNIAIGSTTSRNITAIGYTATVSVDLGEYYIFRKPEVGFSTMRILIAGSQGGIAYSDFYGGSSYVGLTTINTDQFPWIAGVRISINNLGHLILESP